MLRIVPADTRRRIREFVAFPYRLYGDHPWWVPPLRIEERARIDPRKNPFFEHGVIEPLLAVRGRRVVGRIAAILDRLHDEVHEAGTAFFGFFEAADAEAAAPLLGAVEEWAAGRRRRRLRGPVNPSLNDSAGLLVEGFEAPPVLMTPWTPPEYANWVTSAGFEKVKDLYAWEFDLSWELDERALRIAEKHRNRPEVTVRSLDPDRFDRDVRTAMAIYRVAWKDNWGFVPPTEAEIDYLVSRLRPVLEPAGVVFVEVDGEPAGFSVALPDLNRLLVGTGGRLLPRFLFRLLFRRRSIDRGRMLLLGMLPRYQRGGLFSVLITETFRAAREYGTTWAELSWTLEDNLLVNRAIEAFGGRRYRTYRIFEKPLGE